MYEKNYQALADAIVMRAVKDYRRTNELEVRKSIKRFFLSDWFSDLTDTDGRNIVKRLERERLTKRKRKR